MPVSSNTRSKRQGPLLSLQPPPPRRRIPRPPQQLLPLVESQNSAAPPWWQDAVDVSRGTHKSFVFPSEDAKSRREKLKRERRRRQRLANRGWGASAHSRKWRNGRAGARIALVGRGKDGRFLGEGRDLTPEEVMMGEGVGDDEWDGDDERSEWSGDEEEEMSEAGGGGKEVEAKEEEKSEFGSFDPSLYDE